ncbi:ROK family protein [Paracoccus caeni]|uniref:ROK family protein n=1 Tax=Paracoccus caeni TaxID=657651 RepID=A0A934SES6_9RHOB|nr:ROK family protein [Paracoccus caeni]MBK4217551.1 ROK family protein [Paracoccus caeni]
MKTQQIPMLDFYSSLFMQEGPIGRKGRVFMRICGSEHPTRKRLAQEMMIRPATISDLVLELVQDGLVRESRPEQITQKGRPELVLSPNPTGLTAIIINTVSRTLHCTVVDLAGNVLMRERRELDADQIEPDEFLELLCLLCISMRQNLPHGSRLAGVVLSLAGIVDEEARIWRYAAHWPNLGNLSFDTLEQTLGCRVLLAKNLKCELRARMDRAEASAYQRILLLHWGYGVGAAFARRGANGLDYVGHGEVGHISVDLSSTAVCKCGLTGCIEAEIGLWAILARLEDQTIPAEEWSFEEVLRATPHLTDWDRPIDLLAMTLRNLTLTLGPDQCVITGPFTQNAELLNRLRQRFTEIAPASAVSFGGRNVEIVAGAPGIQDELIGAAALVFREELAEIGIGSALAEE